MGIEPVVIVERDEVAVMFMQTADEPGAIGRGWDQLEARLGSLRGRKFLGVFGEAIAGKAYRVCVALRDGDQPEALGLQRGTIAGGHYARVRLHGDPPEVYARIGPAFLQLTQRLDQDASRPHVEFYRRREVIDLLLPIRETLADVS